MTLTVVRNAAEAAQAEKVSATARPEKVIQGKPVPPATLGEARKKLDAADGKRHEIAQYLGRLALRNYDGNVAKLAEDLGRSQQALAWYTTPLCRALKTSGLVFRKAKEDQVLGITAEQYAEAVAHKPVRTAVTGRKRQGELPAGGQSSETEDANAQKHAELARQWAERGEAEETEPVVNPYAAVQAIARLERPMLGGILKGQCDLDTLRKLAEAVDWAIKRAEAQA